jgi:hypothetical protein
MKKIVCLLSITFLMLQSCSSGDGSGNSSQGVLLKKVLGADGSFCNYSYNGNKLLKMTWNDGTSRVISYTGNLITRSEIRDANNTFNGEFDTMSYSNGQLIQYKNYYNNILLFKDDFNYNVDGSRTITEMAYNDITGIYQGTSFSKQYFDSVGNIIKIEHLNSTNVITSTEIYLYDTMNNPMKNITGWTNGPWGSTGLVNNLINNTSIGYTYSYQYNNQGYPISQVFTHGSTSSSCQYFY